jgi:chemotaxis protein CheD
MSEPTRRMVKVAECAVVGPGEILYTLGLGSCVAILLHEPQARLAAMAHVLLPSPRVAEDVQRPAKYAATAVPHLVQEIARAGGEPERLNARLVGGAAMFRQLMTDGMLQTGLRNLEATRAALETAGIPIVGEEVGKEHGRSVLFYPETGLVVVTSVLHGRVEL